jgi:hypothetical protein
MKYSTTKAIVNAVRPGTFQNGVQGYKGYRGYGATGPGTGASISTDMMLGLAIGAVGVVLWCKNQHKIRGSAA